MALEDLQKALQEAADGMNASFQRVDAAYEDLIKTNRRLGRVRMAGVSIETASKATTRARQLLAQGDGRGAQLFSDAADEFIADAKANLADTE